MFKLTNVLNRFKKQVKFTNLPADARISHLSAQADGLIASFRNTHDNLTEINNHLEQVEKEELQKVINAERNLGRASEERLMNRKLQDKLAEFIR